MLARVFCRSISIALRSISATFLLIGAAVAAESVTADPVDFQISEQPLNSALNEFARQSDREIFYASDVVDGYIANNVDGRYEPEDALELLLADSGLEYSVTASDTFLINNQGGDSDSKNVRPAPILMAQNATSQTSTTASSPSSDDVTDGREEESAVPLEEIIVVGTNIRGVENPTVPVLTFDREDIDLSGATTVEEFLRTIPQNFNAVSSLNFVGAEDFNGLSNGLQGTAVDLRGLGGGTTLTLLNGRRMSASGSGSFVDVSVLPLEAIERVEVLTDGASAIYGSDAVAGVVNFITRKDYEGLEVNARYGTVIDGSKEDFGVGVAGGFNWGSGGAIFGVSYTEEKPLLIRELPNIDLTDPGITDNDGTVGREAERISGFLSFNQSVTDRFSAAIDALYSGTDGRSLANSVIAPIQEVRSEQESVFFNAKLDYEITDSITATLFYDYSREDGALRQELDNFEPRDFDNSLYTIEGLVSGRFLSLPSGDRISFAAGGLYREESFDNSDLLLPEALERDVTAVYGELLIPVVSDQNALPFVQAFDLSLAGRYEDYSDFGDTFNPKIGVHWAVSEGLRLTASYSRSFRAPPLNQVFGAESNVVFSAPNFFFSAFPEIASDPDGQTVALATSGANPDLTEETANVWAAGIQYEPYFIEGLSLSASYFLYDYTDRVEVTEFIDILQDPAFVEFAIVDPNLLTVEEIFARSAMRPNVLNILGELTAEDVEFIGFGSLNNVAGRKVDGLDFQVDYEKDTSLGQFAAGINATYLLTFDTQLTEQSPTINQLNILYRPIDLKLRGDVSWSQNGFTAFAAVNHTRGYRDKRDPSIANDIDSFTTVDFTVSYDTSDRFNNAFADGTVLSLSVRNLLDEDPPIVETIDGLNFDTSNVDPFGRQISISLRISF